MITGSKCRHLNRAGRGLHTAPAYQNLLDSNLQHIPSGGREPLPEVDLHPVMFTVCRYFWGRAFFSGKISNVSEYSLMTSRR
jgi:hypothetical protein